MPRANTGEGQITARAFGSVEDVEIDFELGPRPGVVTRLLANSMRVPEDEVWNWPLPRRTEALLGVAIATGGARRSTTAVCPASACRQTVELELDLGQFRGSEAGSFSFSPEPGVEIEARVPTGSDLLKYEQSGFDPVRLGRDLAGGEFRSEWLPALEAALEEHDPLTALELHSQCPYCAAAVHVEFDLEDMLLREFRRRQRDLLEDVHRIAWAYHWNEREILAMPAGRRRWYVERIDREAAR